jgi:diguanylate cyclase (GGDEF)-like protein
VDGGPGASDRLLGRVLKRQGLTASDAPSDPAWMGFLDTVRSLLADQERDRYLLERSLENSSQEMLTLNDGLRASAKHLAVEQQDLRAANSVLAATLDSTADGILVVNVDRRISHYNHRFAQMWQLPEDVLRSADDSAVLTFVLGQLRDPDAFISTVEALYQVPDAESRDTLQFADGRVFERLSLPQYLDGEIIGRVWSFRDVTAEDQLNRELRHRALHDGLTGLANRVAFDDHLQQALRRQARTDDRLAVVVLDLDGFKHINDSLGHQSGDAVLCAIAVRLRAAFRDLDTIARFGGDEFALIVEDVGSPAQAARLGQRLLNILAEPVALSTRQVTLGGSIGITIAGGATDQAEHVLGQADAAMYRAKKEGKGRYRLFERSMHSIAVDRLNTEQALRKAVSNHELTVHYQPVVEARTGRISSFEALARWRDPVKGDIPPDAFIPLAEETGLIHEIGFGVLLSACHQARSWHTSDPGVDVGIAVNVSNRQLVERSYTESVCEALATSGLAPNALTLEITESAFAGDTTRITAALGYLRGLGVRIAIDDFGTGYSSFAALATLPVDILKIDKRFVDAIHESRGRGLIKAIIGIAHTLDLETVAEGVEGLAQQAALVELGCSHLQGYLFAKPMPAEETYAYLQPSGEPARRSRTSTVLSCSSTAAGSGPSPRPSS